MQVLAQTHWKPEIGDEYWFWSIGAKMAIKSVFVNASCDFALYVIGGCFRTQEEAEAVGKPLMEQKIKEYEEA